MAQFESQWDVMAEIADVNIECSNREEVASLWRTLNVIEYCVRQ